MIKTILFDLDDTIFDHKQCRLFSEDVNSRKPDKAIFETALLKGESKPEEAIFIGDSWEADMIGATNCGIKAVWLNRYNRVCPDSSLVYEIQSFNNIDYILNFISHQF